MLISAIHGFRFNVTNPYERKNQSQNILTLSSDRYECGNVVFLGSGTSAGAPLKRLVNAPDPFFGALMIRSERMDKILKDLESCTTVKKAVKYLRKYKPYM